MTLKRLVLSPLLALALAVLCAGTAAAQAAQPTEARLLNGLKLLVFKKPDESKITVKLRIHSGSAFDPLGKEGTMYLLSQILFPNQELREFFKDDLGGSFTVQSKYDYIEIDATAKSDKLIEMLEPIAAAVTNPQINKETTALVKSPAIQSASYLEGNRSGSASLAAAHNLVGNYPYGRPEFGSSTSIAKVDFADLLQAEERFLTSDNATLVIAGNVDPAYTLKIVKRLFGVWTKADKKVPATFAQPEAPKQPLLTQELSAISAGTIELRSAVRGLSRKEALYPASIFLQQVIIGRLGEHHPSNHVLETRGIAMPSVIVFGVTDVAELTKDTAPVSLLAKDVTEAEFTRAKDAVSSYIGEMSSFTGTLSLWLDADTYGLETPDKEIAKIKTVTIVDVQNALNALRKAPTVTTVFTAPKK